MCKFKVGDRVNCYGICRSINGSLEPAKAVINRLYSDSMIGISVDETSTCNAYDTSVHPKQCRKLRPKVRLIAKEVYCNFYEGSEFRPAAHLTRARAEEAVKVSSVLCTTVRYVRAKRQS